MSYKGESQLDSGYFFISDEVAERIIEANGGVVPPYVGQTQVDDMIVWLIKKGENGED